MDGTHQQVHRRFIAQEYGEGWISVNDTFPYQVFFYLTGGKKPVETHAAVWVPDSEATICMHCKKTHFTMINRRVRLL